ncbi:NADPH-dependent F420 reductase [Demequina sp. NBRC 110057]|uniref:NADPH-dependent F420 reductase n=1 Tax=Demequina sp. NBRC 110057 TaxID=1570346 RepID=UPI000A030D9C|nr:NAD(P)-binding domain-containing protein [Demequina sp. NBRC 110057]
MTTLGIIGAGNIGSNVAKAALAAGHDVVIANSRGPETLTDLVGELGDHARAATIEDAATAGDLVLVAIPLAAIDTLPTAPLAGKVVLDANNYYPGRDGRIAALDENLETTSGLLQRHLPQSHVVKAFNHINARDIPADATPAGTADRRALGIFGEDPDAKRVAAAFLDSVGYDAVDLGGLAESWRLERDTPGYGKPMTAAQVREIAAATERVVQQ